MFSETRIYQQNYHLIINVLGFGETYCSLFLHTDLSRALVITELGYSRNEENLNMVMTNLRKLAEEPNPVHRLGNVANILKGGLTKCFVQVT